MKKGELGEGTLDCNRVQPVLTLHGNPQINEARTLGNGLRYKRPALLRKATFNITGRRCQPLPVPSEVDVDSVT